MSGTQQLTSRPEPPTSPPRLVHKHGGRGESVVTLMLNIKVPGSQVGKMRGVLGEKGTVRGAWSVDVAEKRMRVKSQQWPGLGGVFLWCSYLSCK